MSMFSGVLFDYVSPGADDAAKRGAEGFMADNVTLSIGGFPEFADGFPELLGADSAMICFPTPTTGASLLPRSGKFPRLLWQIVQAGVQDGILNWTPDGTHVLYGNTPNNDAHLSKLISTYLKTHLLSSFKKQLSNYGFQQNANGFASPYFLRDQPEQLVHICRQLRPQEVQRECGTRKQQRQRALDMLAIEDIAMKPKSNPEQEQEQDSTKKKKRKRRRGSSKPETKTSALLELLTAALYECKASTARTENLLQEMRAEFQDALNPERRKVSECHACAKRKKRRARKQD